MLKFPIALFCLNHAYYMNFVKYDWPEKTWGKIITWNKMHKEIITDKATYIFIDDYRQMMGLVISDYHLLWGMENHPDLKQYIANANDRRNRGWIYLEEHSK